MSASERFDDWLNPIAVKELRQAVRGKFVTVAITLSLLGELIAVATITINRSLAGSIQPIGPIAFSALFGIVFTAALFLVPIYTGFRMAAERADTNIDLFFVTTIRPITIVLGKVTSAAMLVILLFSASLPFLVFSYVLRGIDFIIIAGMIAFAILVVVSEATLALFIGCLPTSKPFKLFLGVAFFIGTFFVYVPILQMMSHLMRGYGMFLGMPNSWKFIVTFIVTILLIDAILIVLTTAIITPAAANRALPIRTMILTAAVLSFVGALWILLALSDIDPLQVWSMALISVTTLVLLSATSERERWGPRVARTIPGNPLRRAFAFLFYSGGAGGTLWAIGMFAATTGLYAICAATLRRTQLSKWVYLADAALAMIGYAMTAVLLRRTVLLRRVPASRTWGVALALFFLLTVLPPLAMLAGDSETTSWSTWVHVTTILNPFPLPQRPPDLAWIRTGVLAVWAAAAIVANAGWFAAQWRVFRRDLAESRAISSAETLVIENAP